MSNGDRTPAKARVTAPLRSAGAAVSPRVEPMATPESFKSRAYSALRDAIVSMDVYRSRDDIRLDERRLALDFGISRTPVREAMAQLTAAPHVCCSVSSGCRMTLPMLSFRSLAYSGSVSSNCSSGM